MSFDNIPSAMKNTPHWIVWKLEDKGSKKPTKTPYRVKGGFAKVNDSSTWSTFEAAVQAYENGGYSGIGFVFKGTPFIGIDIDHVYTPEKRGLDQTAAEALVIAGETYIELSQSGTGFHAILKGKLPDGRRKSEPFEMYGEGSNRYFAMTGNQWSNCREIREDQAAIDTIHSKYIEPQDKPLQSAPLRQPETISLSEDQIVERAMAAKNGALFSSLWAGDTSAYDGDDSRADMALCNILAFWCQKDASQMDRLFRQSALYRPKWDKRHGHDTYGGITIAEAIAGCQDVYSPHTQKVIKPEFRPREAEKPTEWETPIPFDMIDTPDFPTECLPPHVAAFVEALAESTQTPTEMAAVLSLGVLATALQSKFELEITSDWKEPLCLYTVAIAPPGERKSAVIGSLTRPVYGYEAERRESEAVEIRRNQDERSMLEQRLEGAKKNAAKAKGDNALVAKQEALDLSAELAEFKDIYPFRLLVDDTTPEKLVDIMDTQGGCIAVSSAEGGVFDAMSGRYDKSTNLDIYLKGHAGDPISVDRVGRKSNFVKEPRLTMMLAIQPEVLTGLMDNATFRGRGLCGRFLYVKCKSKVSRRNVNPPSIPYEVKSQYNQFVQDILAKQYKGTIRLSNDAQKLRIQYAKTIEHRLGNTLEHMRDWGGKAVGAMLRIAGLIHASEVQVNPAEVNISAETVAAAVKIMEVLCVHAMAVYQDMGSDETIEDAKYLLRRINEAGQDEISKRDLFDLCKGKFKKVEAMEPAVQTLVDMGYIREVETGTGKRGRPSKKIIANLTSKNSNNSKNINRVS